MNLPDINVWLALAFEVHVHHTRARNWFEEVDPGDCAFCRFSQMGFLRLASNPAVFGNEAVTMDKAWSCYDRLLTDERVCYVTEPSDLERPWRENTHRQRHSHRIWNDAYLVAFGKAAEFRLVTFDGGFRMYKGIDVLVL